MSTRSRLAWVLFFASILITCGLEAQSNSGCERTITAKVVAIDQPYLINRLGASMPEGMTFALERDVISKKCTGTGPCTDPLIPGEVMLRPDKRPRPIVLRANIGDCLVVTFRNLLSKFPAQNQQPPVQPATRCASFHAAGMQLVNSIMDDGSFAGMNPNSTIRPENATDSDKGMGCAPPSIPPGNKAITYTIKATEEGTFLVNSMGAIFGGFNQPNDGAQVSAGLFGAVNVQPAGAEWYRSQVTHSDLEFAIDHSKGVNGFSPGANGGQPFLNYEAVYPPGNPRAGMPVLAMLDKNNEIVHTDLTAVITGPHHGKFKQTGDPNLQKINIEPNRLDPYREFTIEYHELNDMVQAFPIFNATGANTTRTLASGTKVTVNGSINFTLQASGDAFAINYGTGGIGAEILANRFGLGPMGSCPDCKFEEFFLSAWPVGDVAQIPDVPANTPCSNMTNNPMATSTNNPLTGNPYTPQPCTPGVAGNAPAGVTPQRKAKLIRFPDDPSNVYHSYINDRVKFRILHAGTGVSHVHHLHAHQWVHSPNSDGSAYLDSQLINPGSAYTLEIAFNGSGNRNKVVGDSIFHCHFYPHFAAGMWAMWRSHDVFEVGSPFKSGSGSKELDKYSSRALPDGEVADGAPIPAIVPMPMLAMPPMPGRVKVIPVPDPNGGAAPVGYRADLDQSDLKNKINPGFPFFIPGVAGSRPPHPPLDFAVQNGKELDGGLPRHIILNALITDEKHTTLDFSKEMEKINSYQLPEDGTPEEKVAIDFHSTCFHPSVTPEGVSAGYRTNGLPARHGAPYANPGLVPYDENNPPVGIAQCKEIKEFTIYKAAVIQRDVVLNKKGWHIPQARYLTLWQDVLPNMNNQVAPEPFFIRANAGEVVEYWHTNLVPSSYLLDDFEVRTPTDIIGQHIHLVKFDVTSSDGAENGYNYEDGTLSYQEVEDQIKGINQCGGLALSLATINKCGTATGRKPNLKPTDPPKEICPDPNVAPCSTWKGAQTTVQRWLADPIPHENQNGTRTLRSVFTHDHFGPSTHQQTGLYAALLVEPTGSKWSMSETGAPLHTRTDGGPTTWNAIIETAGQEKNTYREFALAVQDFAIAYFNGSISTPDPRHDWGFSDSPFAIEPTGPPISDPRCVVGTDTCWLKPQIVSAGPTQGTTSFNYRNEPLPYRVASGASSDPRATDLSYVFSSTVPRNDAQMSTQPPLNGKINPADVSPTAFRWPQKALTTGMMGPDPFTPLLRTYEGDRVQIRLVAGAHMLPHAFTVGGMKWLFEPSFDDSGYRSTQEIGISEHFEFLFTTPRSSPSPNTSAPWADFLYMPDASTAKHGIIDGTWGIIRAYQSNQTKTSASGVLQPLSTNLTIKPLKATTNPAGYSCPQGATMKTFNVVAQSPASVMLLNRRGADGAGPFNNPIYNQAPLYYTLSNNMNTTEPLILRANAGDCIAVTVNNQFSSSASQFTNFSSTVPWDNSATPQTINPSKYVGLTPALLSFDAMKSTGLNVGWNPDQVVAIGGAPKTYYWYAGQTEIDQAGNIKVTPIELAGANLTPSDPLQQSVHGMIGGAVIEPPKAIACVDTFNPQVNMPQYASATLYDGGTCAAPGKLLYREFVMLTQDDLANAQWDAATYNIGGSNGITYTSPAGSTQVAVNFRTEPMAYRFNDSTGNFYTRPDIWLGFSDGLVLADPQIPIFTAAAKTPTRFHLLHPGGSGDQQVYALHGHVWQELPFVNKSTAIGNNTLSQYLGARDNHGTNSAYQIVLPSAGGNNGIMGDYLWRTTPANFLEMGLWGLFRVGKSGSDVVNVASAQFAQGSLAVYGTTSVFVDTSANPKNGQRSPTVSLSLVAPGGTSTLLANNVPVTEAGQWNFQMNTTAITGNGYSVSAVSPNGGTSSTPVLLAVIPGTPTGPTESRNGESIRFVNTPLDHGAQKSPDPKARPEGLATPDSGTPQVTDPKKP